MFCQKCWFKYASVHCLFMLFPATWHIQILRKIWSDIKVWQEHQLWAHSTQKRTTCFRKNYWFSFALQAGCIKIHWLNRHSLLEYIIKFCRKSGLKDWRGSTLLVIPAPSFWCKMHYCNGNPICFLLGQWWYSWLQIHLKLLIFQGKIFGSKNFTLRYQ